jgi:uridine phosphorylase
MQMSLYFCENLVNVNQKNKKSMHQASELILNKNGSIYHLNLLPEQIGETIFTVGDPSRVSDVSKHFDKIEHKVKHREFVTHTGWLGKKKVSVISTGIGTDNVDIVLNELDALVNFDLKSRKIKSKHTQLTFIRIGTSGSIQHDVPVDSNLISIGAFGLDGLLHFYDADSLLDNDFVKNLNEHAKNKWDFPAKPYYVTANESLIKQFSKGSLQGITATNIGFYAPQGRQLRAEQRFQGYMGLLQTFKFNGQKITNLEMETSAIYGLSSILGHKAISLNAILANRADGTFSKNPKKVVADLIKKTLSQI